MIRKHGSPRCLLVVMSALCFAFATAAAMAQYTLYEYTFQEQPGYFLNPWANGIAAGPDGEMWFVSIGATDPILQESQSLPQPPPSLFAGPHGDTPSGAITTDATRVWLGGYRGLLWADTSAGNTFGLVEFGDAQTAQHQPDSIGWDGRSTIWFTDYRLTSGTSARLLGSWVFGVGVPSEQALAPPCDHPGLFGRDMARDMSGNMWFTSSDHVCRIDALVGSLSSQPLKDGNGQTYANAASIAAGPDGRMWVTTYNGPTGSLLAFFPGNCGPGATCPMDAYMVPGTQGNTPRELHGIAAGPDGRIWFTADKDVPGVGSVKTDGTDFQYNQFSNIAIPPDARPHKITAGPNGDNSVWFSDIGNTARVWRLGGLVIPSNELLLQGGQFRVDVAWSVPPQGTSGVGTAIPIAPDTGAFWFFSPNNLELMVKVLDGRGVNGHWWVFFGSLTNVEFDLTVTNLVTGVVQHYHNPYGTQASVQDTAAFSTVSPPPQRSMVHEVQGSVAFDPADLVLAELASERMSPAAATQPACTPDAQTLCLNASRFKVQVAWDVPSQGTSGNGTAGSLTGDTGTFWFFSSNNLELIIKVLDGRAINNHFWVFYGALSNVEYTITITDTQTGTVRTYHNPYQNVASVSDTSAF